MISSLAQYLECDVCSCGKEGTNIWWYENHPSDMLFGYCDEHECEGLSGKCTDFLHNLTRSQLNVLMKLLALSKDEDAVVYVTDHNLSLAHKTKIQLAAVQQYGEWIRYINNPSEAIQLAAVNQDGGCIRHIDSPSECIQLAAVNQNKFALPHIKNPSATVVMRAIENGYPVNIKEMMFYSKELLTKITDFIIINSVMGA